MSSTVKTTSLVRSLATRSFVTQAQRAAASRDVQTRTADGNTVVSACDSPVTGLVKVAVAFRAGSRFESPENAGVSHVLRSACGLTTKSVTNFAMIRNLQKLGSTLSATSDRETIVYTLESTTENLEPSLSFLRSAVTQQSFKPWELQDNIPRIKYELASLPMEALLFDLVHKAAYRRGLGNSIFVKEYNLKGIGSETLQHFVENRFLASRAAVAGVGVTMDELMKFTTSLQLNPTSTTPSGPSPYHGGDLRKESKSRNAQIIIASEASGLNKKDVFTYAVLAKALGSGTSIRRGTGVDPLSKIGSMARAVNLSHSDSGLFGIWITSEGSGASASVAAAMKAVKSGITDADVNRGKAQLKGQVLYGSETTDGLLYDMANQGVLIGSVKSAPSLLADIDAVSTQQVKVALDSFIKGKKTVAAIGSVQGVPYADDL